MSVKAKMYTKSGMNISKVDKEVAKIKLGGVACKDGYAGLYKLEK